jgi:hypothetical protein
MIKRWKWWVGVSVVLCSLQQVLACGGGPQIGDLACLPGLALVGMHAGLVLSILAGFIERPFLTWAGVQRFPIEYSIQANFFGTVGTGVVGLFIFDGWFHHDLEIAWVPASIAMTAWLEWMWVVRPWKRLHRRARFWPLILGNLVSAGVIFTLPFLSYAVGTHSNSYIRMVRPFREEIAVITFIGCAIVYFIAFRRTWGDVIVADDPRRGFEVIPVAVTAQA